MLPMQRYQCEIPICNPYAYLFIYDGKFSCYRDLNVHICIPSPSTAIRFIMTAKASPKGWTTCILNGERP